MTPYSIDNRDDDEAGPLVACERFGIGALIGVLGVSVAVWGIFFGLVM